VGMVCLFSLVKLVLSRGRMTLFGNECGYPSEELGDLAAVKRIVIFFFVVFRGTTAIHYPYTIHTSAILQPYFSHTSAILVNSPKITIQVIA